MGARPCTSPVGSGRNPREEGRGAPKITTRREKSNPKQWQLMEAVVERENMMVALERVERNKGSSGIDKMSVEALRPYLRDQWPRIKEELLAGCYQPQPVRRVEIPKPGGKGVRQLGIPTVVDRLIQQAVHQVLQPVFDEGFSESSYGFRPQRSAQKAVRKAREYVATGRRWVVDIDLEKFFRPCEPRYVDVAGGTEGQGQEGIGAHTPIPASGSDGRRSGISSRRRYAARRSPVAVTVQHHVG